MKTPMPMPKPLGKPQKKFEETFSAMTAIEEHFQKKEEKGK